MRVLHLVSFYTPAFRGGGPILSIHNLNKWLVKKGIDVTVFTTSLNGVSGNLKVPLCQPVDVEGVTVWYFPSLFLKKWEYSRALHKKLAETMPQFDVIHIDSIFRATSMLGGYYARKHEKPYLISPRGGLMKEPLKKKSSLKKKIYLALVEKKNLAGADAIHFTVERERQDYEALGLPARKAVVIPNFLDFEDHNFTDLSSCSFRKKFFIPVNKKVIIFLGRISWIKGLDTLIPAFAKVALSDSGAMLVIAGNDDEGYGKSVKQDISKYGIKNRVLFAGFLEGREKIAALCESDVFVLPSYSENFGMAVIEAMFCGVPVIVTENVGVAEDVKRTGAGIVVRKQKDEMAFAIKTILDNPENARQMGARGKLLAKNVFAPSRVTHMMISVYDDIISKRAKNYQGK